MSLRCKLCPTRAARSNGRWASVLRDEPGSTPVILCPRCADRAQTGVEKEVDEKTGKVTDRDLPARPFDATIQRF